MTEVLDALLPWLIGQQPLQWGALALMIATVLAGWLATYVAVLDDLGPLFGAVAAALSAAFGVGGLALGRYLLVQIGTYSFTLPPPGGEQPPDHGGHIMGGIVLVIGMAAVGVMLLMGLGLALALGATLGVEGTAIAFWMLSGAGVALWIAHEITLVILIAHNGWPPG